MPSSSLRPIKPSWVLRFLATLAVFLALLAGYYHAISEATQQQYQELQWKTQALERALGPERAEQILKDLPTP